MNITERLIWALALGAAIATIIAYVTLTREKRIISNVRDRMRHLSDSHGLQYERAVFPQSTEVATDEEILALYRWAQEFGKSARTELDPIAIAAEALICEKLLGLSRFDVIKALQNAKSAYELGTYLQKKTN
jgi:hypothetical protein